MNPDDTEDRQVFRHGAFERYGLGFTLGLLLLMLILMSGLAANMAAAGEFLLALLFGAVTVFFVLLGQIVMRDFLMRNAWRISLGPVNGWFELPAGRLLYETQPAMSGPLAYSAIRNIEWREEAFRTMGMASINRVYAIRLKSGGAILAGEDRPIPSTDEYTSLVGEAMRALAERAGVKVRQLPMARGKGGFLTLWGTARPPWPDTDETIEISEADERAIRQAQMVTQFLPVIAFAVVLVARLIG